MKKKEPIVDMKPIPLKSTLFPNSLNIHIKSIMCIYKIENSLNKHSYIGSAVNLRRRIRLHLNLLRKNKHHSTVLQNAFNEYDEHNFRIIILEIVHDIDMLIKTEQKWIDLDKPIYNMTLIAGKNCHIGCKRTQKTKDKMRNAQLGKTHTEETKEKLRFINLGKKQSEATRKKRSDSCKKSIKFQNALRSKERMDKIKNTRLLNGGYIVTETMKSKISNTLKGRSVNGVNLRVQKYSLNNVLVETYFSLFEAERKNKLYKGCLSRNFKKGKNTIKGYIWKIIRKYKNET